MICLKWEYVFFDDVSAMAIAVALASAPTNYF